MEYEVVIGLEVHCELATKSKIYCACSTEFGKDANANVCPICLAMPGALPVLNKKVVEYGIRAGLALNCSIAEKCKQDRKNYFYPDLPSGYQLSQLDEPLCIGGYLDINVDGNEKRINLARIHFEEDAGKLVHDEWGKGSLVDLNRGSVPLIEIVSEPDMRSAEEVNVYLEKLKSILEFIGVSDCKMQQGSLRADVNISVRPAGQKEYGVRTEMKNINSFKSITRAIEFESKRHINILETGSETLVQETRRWDDVKGESYSMRNKENAVDYRYFPEPNLAPVIVDEAWLNEICSALPELPHERKSRYVSDYGLPEYDAGILTTSIHLSDLFQEAVDSGAAPKSASNWIMGALLRILNDKNLEPSEIPFNGKRLHELIILVETGKINNNSAKKVLQIMFEKNETPGDIVKTEGFEAVSDTGELQAIAAKVIDANPKSLADYMDGKEKAFGYFVGQVMRETKGKADPQTVTGIIKERLDKLK